MDYEALFWSKVDKTGTCWTWTKGLQHGYGTFWDGTRSVRAHRYAYLVSVGRLAEDQLLDHACRNLLCVRPHPDHVRLATHQTNGENKANASQGTVTGVRGVYLHRASGKYGARAGSKGKMHYTKLFDTIEEAAAAVRELRLRLHTHNYEDRNVENPHQST